MYARIRSCLTALLLGAALAAAAGGAWARNDKLLLPLEPALRSNGTRQLLAPDIALRFGKASAAGVDTSAGDARVHAAADPFTGPSSTGQRRRRSDELVCLDAFRQALVELQSRARASGAGAVVGIVSNYKGVEMDSPAAYECHIGHTRGVVDLKGQFARTAAPQPAVAPPVPAPAPLAPSAVVQPRPIASGFAAIDDVDAIPFLSDRGRKGYAEWLTRSTPRAFAISPKGHWYATWGLEPKDASLPSDPGERALLMCERAARMPCKLYALNGSVVWVKE